MVLLSAGTFTVYSVFLSIMGVPYAILLGLLGSMLEFIPTIGPVVAVLAILLVVVVSGGHFLTILIFLVCYRVLMDYFASPHVMGQGVNCTPCCCCLACSRARKRPASRGRSSRCPYWRWRASCTVASARPG